MKVIGTAAEARAEMKELWGKASAIREKARTEKRNLTTEENSEFDQVMKDFDDAKAFAEREEKAEAAKKHLEDPVRPRPHGAAGDTKGAEEGNDEPEEAQFYRLDEKSIDYKLRFSKRAVDRAGYKCLRRQESLRTDDEKKAWTKLQQKANLSSLADRDGGDVTSPQLETELITRIRDLVQIRQRATVRQISKESVKAPTFEFTGSLARVNEKGTAAVQSVTNFLGRQVWTPQKFMAIIKAPAELLEDEDYPLVEEIVSLYAMYWAEQEEQFFLTGTGNAQPLGILTALANIAVGSTGTRQVDIAGSTTAIVADDLISALYTLKAQYRNNAAWMMHRLVIAAIRKLKDVTSGQYIWYPGLGPGAADALLGRPLMESEYMPDPYAGADNDPMALLGDWKTYRIYDRVGTSIVRDDSKYRETDEVGYFIRRRLDAGPTIAEAWVRLNRK